MFCKFECKRSKSSQKRREKLAKAEMSRHNFRMSRHNFRMSLHNFKITSRAMSQQEMICRNKEEVELEIRVNIDVTFHNFVVT